MQSVENVAAKLKVVCLPVTRHGNYTVDQYSKGLNLLVELNIAHGINIKTITEKHSLVVYIWTL